MADFSKAIVPLWGHEGGKVDDPDDPGGATNMGITLAVWRQLGKDLDGDGDIDKQDLWKMTKEHAAAIYKRAYWNPVLLDQFNNQSIADTVFDYAVNAGVRRAIILTQYILKETFGYDIEIDGRMGPRTIAAVNAVDQKQFFLLFQAMRAAHYCYRGSQGCRTDWVEFLRRPIAQGGLGLSPSKTSSKFVSGWLKRVDHFKYSA